jgi:transcriptional regulator GlxA family with amidase domain
VFKADQASIAILSCTAGTGNFYRGREHVEFRPGSIAPILAAQGSCIESEGSFAHIWTHISSEAINAFCSKLLGHPLDQPVLFAHTPFSNDLKVHWEMVIRSLNRLLDTDHPSYIAINSLEEYAIALLLEKHPHNFSTRLQCRQTVSARTIQDAKRFIEQNTHRALTVSDVAAFVGCGIRALHQGFCENLGLTPRAYLHFARMAQVRSNLRGDRTEPCAAEIASKLGFTNLDRFTASYVARYGEDPSETFRRQFNSTGSEAIIGRDTRKSGLTPAKIDLLRHHINVTLGERITVAKLAALVGMSPQNFAVAFKIAFKTTPAQHILSERLKWANWLLANTDTSISAVAAETGFASQSHLTSVSTRLNGQTPHEFRKLSRLR